MGDVTNHSRALSPAKIDITRQKRYLRLHEADQFSLR